MTSSSFAIIVPARVIVALRPHTVGPKDPRERLRGVCLSWSPHGATLAATDGHALLAYRLDYDGEPFAPVILPPDLLKQVKPVAGNVVIDVAGSALSMTQKQTTIVGQALEGTFPRWQKVVPPTCSGVLAQYSGALLGKLWGSGRVLRGERPGIDRSPGCHVYHNGEGPAVVDLHDENAIAVIMPWQPVKNQPEQPLVPVWALPE